MISQQTVGKVIKNQELEISIAEQYPVYAAPAAAAIYPSI
jgi:hypothetical protein